ncbi:MAG: hypothetical protein ABH817_00035 [archaeon]
MHNKKAAIQFAWIFAVIIGALVLFLAFYFIGTNVERSGETEQTVLTQGFDTILNPFSYVGAMGAAMARIIELPKPQDINFTCEKDSSFGSMTMVLSKETKGLPKTINDKYIFSRNLENTKQVLAISMPLKLPWRVADIIVFVPMKNKYCIKNSGSDLKKLLTDLTENIDSGRFVFDNCDPENVKITLDRTLPDELQLASAFSDPDIYECNVIRLKKRLGKQVDIYNGKIRSLIAAGCNMNIDLNLLEIEAGKANKDVETLVNLADSIARLNKIGSCSLF